MAFDWLAARHNNISMPTILTETFVNNDAILSLATVLDHPHVMWIASIESVMILVGARQTCYTMTDNYTCVIIHVHGQNVTHWLLKKMAKDCKQSNKKMIQICFLLTSSWSWLWVESTTIYYLYQQWCISVLTHICVTEISKNKVWVNTWQRLHGREHNLFVYELKVTARRLTQRYTMYN